MTIAIRMHRQGGPEVLQLETVELPPPGPGEARVRHTAIGLNFVDVYHRSGLYPTQLPEIPGTEAAGVVEAVGPGVTRVAPGDRVACATGPQGTYAGERNVAARYLVKIPDGVDDRTAAAILLKGMTAGYLIHETRALASGESIVLQAAAGGVGRILAAWARAKGATVIGVVSTEAKAELARASGCRHVFLTGADLPARVKELTGGSGVPVAYDAVGKATWERSLQSLARRGHLVLFGNASGPVPPIDPLLLARAGSLTLTRPRLGDYVPDEASLDAAAARLFDAVKKGHVKAEIGQTFPLKNAADAQRALEARETTGSTLLIP
jgi:NADPH2:quinone reductase